MLKLGQVKDIYEKKGAGRAIQGIASNTVRRYLKSPEAIKPKSRPLL